MVSAEQRWNEARREHNRVVPAYHRAAHELDSARFITGMRWSANVGMTNRERAQIMQKAQSNFNRVRANYNRVVKKVSAAYRELVRQYYPQGLRVPNQNAAMNNLVRAKKARVRRNARARALFPLLPPSLANYVAHLAS
jgi:hypothetical protein